jgi:hypothetical protein
MVPRERGCDDLKWLRIVSSGEFVKMNITHLEVPQQQ